MKIFQSPVQLLSEIMLSGVFSGLVVQFFFLLTRINLFRLSHVLCAWCGILLSFSSLVKLFVHFYIFLHHRNCLIFFVRINEIKSKITPIFSLSFLYLSMKFSNLHTYLHIYSSSSPECWWWALFYMVIEQIMEKERRSKIYARIQREFNVSEIKCYYYCANINYFVLIDKLRQQHPDGEIMVRVDHVVVSMSNGIIVYLLCTHSSGKCEFFFHE